MEIVSVRCFGSSYNIDVPVISRVDRKLLGQEFYVTVNFGVREDYPKYDGYSVLVYKRAPSTDQSGEVLLYRHSPMREWDRDLPERYEKAPDTRTFWDKAFDKAHEEWILVDPAFAAKPKSEQLAEQVVKLMTEIELSLAAKEAAKEERDLIIASLSDIGFTETVTNIWSPLGDIHD